MASVGNDRWRAVVPVESLGRYRFLVRAKVDHFATWARDLEARAERDKSCERIRDRGRSHRAGCRTRQGCRSSDALGAGGGAPRLGWRPGPARPAAANRPPRRALSPTMATSRRRSSAPSSPTGSAASSARCPPRPRTASSSTFFLDADPAKARFSTWYEMFPRSASPEHGDATAPSPTSRQLGYVEQMGFDVLYLPPIHPIGRTGRKGRDGAPTAGPGDPGSPWAIGAGEGGHTAVHPELGTIEDFGQLVAAAAAGASTSPSTWPSSASPDHPWVSAHPEWFRHRPDGSHPLRREPARRRYEDIYPLDFETADWQALWAELLGVVRFWIAHGVKVFRVDNPHTKPFAFWEWLHRLGQGRGPRGDLPVRGLHPPTVMEQLAKVGFTQSYTYFTWRTSKWELENYMTELTTPRSPTTSGRTCGRTRRTS